MKMPRSHCEAENVNFVQELAEVDGPFESPIDINFRDLAKLELPCLVWNRSSVPPKKMKITNTGHTVIISGKWKCERPYLTGGPLLGKYVFSQIHFHWGHDERRGSEHQICGEGFPLEMHVAHFKAEYATQENALREKDGMVVLVYLFKIQEEPNICLKSIINLLPFIHQPSTSHHIDPRPILALCNPFTDDYFMYWGSVVTSTCAHILLWIVSREPFGISREQVNEFRKILDSSQQPIQRNSRELQPLHKRNVFHVNASKNLDQPLLPIRTIYRCYCRGSEENVCEEECGCHAHRIQEEIQGGNVENLNASQNGDLKCKNAAKWTGVSKDIRVQQTLFVHSATIQKTPLFVKKFDSDQTANITENVQILEKNSKTKLVSYSCCFVPAKQKSIRRLEKRKSRDKKKNFNSVKALGHILNSLETIKNHTVKKLKEIESINEEIKGIKVFCNDSQDKKWFKTIEKILSRQKQFTIKTSKECINEIKNLATECNLDKLFDKNFPIGDQNFKMIWENVNEAGEQVHLASNENLKSMKDMDILQKLSQLNFQKAIKFSNKAQRLLESFFEDIKESEDIQQSVQKDIQLKKISSLYKKQAGDCISVEKLLKEGFITQKLFNIGNLEDRFFTEVVAEEREPEKSILADKNEGSKKCIPVESNVGKAEESEKQENTEDAEKQEDTCATTQSNNEEIIPLHRANNTVLLSHEVQTESEENSNAIPTFEKYNFSHLGIKHDLEINSKNDSTKNSLISNSKIQSTKEILSNLIEKKENKLINRSLLKDLVSSNFFKNLKYSSSSTSTAELSETRRMIMGKIHKMLYKQNILDRKPSLIMKSSLKEFSNYKKYKIKNKSIENNNLNRKKSKNRRKKIGKGKKSRKEIAFSRSSTSSKEAFKYLIKKPTWKKLAKATFESEMEKTNEHIKDVTLEISVLSSERKKLKLNHQKLYSNSRKKRQPSKHIFFSSSESEINADTNKYINKREQKKESDYEEITKCKKKESFEQILSHSTLVKTNIPNETLKQNHYTQVIKENFQYAETAESKNTQISNQEDYLAFKPIKLEEVKPKIQQSIPPKLMFKNKSLTNLTNKVSSTFETFQRVFVENFEKRQKNARESFKLFKEIQNKKPVEEFAFVKKFNEETSYEVEEDNNVLKNQKEETDSLKNNKIQDIQSSKIIEYKVGVFTAASLIDKEVTPKTQKLDIQRYTGIEKKENEKPEEVVTINQLEKESTKIESKTEVNPPKLVQAIVKKRTKDYNESFKSFFSLSSEVKKRSPRKPYSVRLKSHVKSTQAKQINVRDKIGNHQSSKTVKQVSEGSINSSGKTIKVKVKKRPHYNRRNFKYHLKKTSSTFKKNEKTEKKPVSPKLLSEEEQLKIISENVVKYLKIQLAASKCNFDHETNTSRQNQEEFQQNIESEKNKNGLKCNKASEKTPGKKIPQIFYTKNFVETEKSKCRNCDIYDNKQKEKSTNLKISPETLKKNTSNTQKPTNNFIKLNKLMAGKYKRLRPPENQPEKEKLKKITTHIPKPIPRKKEHALSSDFAVQKLRNNNLSTPNKPNGKPISIERPKQQNQTKTQINVKVDESNMKKLKNHSLLERTEIERKVRLEDQIQSVSDFQKISPMKRWVPTYMLTSYLPNPIEISETKKTKLNRCLLKMQTPRFVTDSLFDVKQEKKENKKDKIVSSDLEYLVNVQMCLNSEISAKVENSMNHVKTIFSQDQNKMEVIEKTQTTRALDFIEPCKGILVIGANKIMNNSTSNTDYLEDSIKISNNSLGEHKLKIKDVSSPKAMKESGDSELIISPARDSDNQDYNSDSSYNCEILITVNSETNEKETEVHVHKSKSHNDKDKSNHIISMEKECETNKQEIENSDQSILLKPQRKKRKENEISVEMKQKLLEILEGEIKREMGISCKSSLENISEEVSLKWKNTESVNKTQNSATNSDNAEVLTEISETMKQYLSNLKQRCLATKRKNKERKKRKEKDAI